MKRAARAAEQTNTTAVVNVNTADAAQLTLLPGVGVKTAQAIIDYRTEHCAFRVKHDLKAVKGLGAKRVERMWPYVVLEGKTTATAKIRV